MGAIDVLRVQFAYLHQIVSISQVHCSRADPTGSVVIQVSDLVKVILSCACLNSDIACLPPFTAPHSKHAKLLNVYWQESDCTCVSMWFKYTPLITCHYFSHTYRKYSKTAGLSSVLSSITLFLFHPCTSQRPWWSSTTLK